MDHIYFFNQGPQSLVMANPLMVNEQTPQL